MATTVNTATLTVNVTEQITLNGVAYDQTVTKTISDVAQISKRVLSLGASGSHAIASFSKTPTGASYDSDDVKYLRVTNLDDTNAVIVNITNGADAAIAVNLNAGDSFVMFDDSFDGNATGTVITGSLHEIEAIYVATPASEVDVELVVATI